MPVSNPQNGGNAAFNIIKSVVRKREAVNNRAAVARKANELDLVLVYDQNGNVIGACDPADITSFANSAPAPGAQKKLQSGDKPPANASAPADAAPDVDVAKRLRRRNETLNNLTLTGRRGQ